MEVGGRLWKPGRSLDERRCSPVPEEDRSRPRGGGGDRGVAAVMKLMRPWGGGKLFFDRRLDLSCLSPGILARLLGLGLGLRYNTNPVLRHNTNPVPQCTVQKNKSTVTVLRLCRLLQNVELYFGQTL